MPAKTPPPSSLSPKAKTGKSRNKTPPPQPADKLITSEAVFKKLRWHPNVDTENIEVGYIDRFSGLRWMKMNKWREGGSLDFDSIPWHRVMQFANNGILFWDRENRSERLADLFDGTLASAAQPAPVVSTANDDKKNKSTKKSRTYPRTDRADLRDYCPTTKTWKHLAPSSTTTACGSLSRPVRILTQNVLFAKFDGDILHYSKRWPFLIDTIRHESNRGGPIDIVSFQETDSKFISFLTQNKWFQTNYQLTEFDFGREGIDTVMCFLKGSAECQCISVAIHQFTPHVHAVCCEVVVAGKHTVHILNTHLTSDKANDAQRKRAIQLEGLFKMSARHQDSILMGDFNFGDGGENDAIDWGKYKDCSSDSGYTFDPISNNLAAWNSRQYISRRLDRMVIRSSAIQPSPSKLLGTNFRSIDSSHYRQCLLEGSATTVEDIATIFVRGIPCSGKSTLASILQSWITKHCDDTTAVIATREAATSSADWIRLVQQCAKKSETERLVRIIDSPNILLSDLKALQQLCNVSLRNVLVLTIDTDTVKCHSSFHSNSGAVGGGGSSNPTVEVFNATKNILNSETPGVVDVFNNVDVITGDNQNYDIIEKSVCELLDINLTSEATLSEIVKEWTQVPKPAGEVVPVFTPSDHFGVVVEFDISDVPEDDVSPEQDDDNTEISQIPRVISTFDRNVALAVVLPKPLADKLAPLREKYDKAFKTWPAHLNLVWPFIPMGCYLNNRSNIVECMKNCNVTPFRITLRKLTSFNDHTRNRSSLYLAPEYSSEFDSMRVLRQELDNHFIDSSTKKSFHGYNPHCTVGRSTPADVDKIAKQYKWNGSAGDNVISFWVSELCVLTKTSEDGPMTVVDQINIPTEVEVDPLYYHDANIWNSSKTVLPPLEVPKTIMEPHPLGGRKSLPLYSPGDQLERFMLHFTRRLAQVEGQSKAVSLCQDSPTHISQRGGKYYLPEGFINHFLRYWKTSIEEQSSNNTPFYMEEIRGAVFRLYIDVDIKLTSGEYLNIHDKKWLNIIIPVAAKVYKKTNIACVVMKCDGNFTSEPHPEITLKSGYRLYFLDTYTGYKDYKKFIDTLQQEFISQVEANREYQQDNIFDIKDVIDTQSTGWERGRLVGTQKRRKNIDRRYTFDSVWSLKSDTVSENSSLSTFLSSEKNIEAMLYSTTLRMWGVVPKFAFLRSTLVPDIVEKYFHLIICSGDGMPTAVDLITLQETQITSSELPSNLTTTNTAVIGFDYPPSLSRFTFILYSDFFLYQTRTAYYEGGELAAESPLQFITSQLTAHRAASAKEVIEKDINIAKVMKLIVSATVSL